VVSSLSGVLQSPQKLNLIWKGCSPAIWFAVMRTFVPTQQLGKLGSNQTLVARCTNYRCADKCTFAASARKAAMKKPLEAILSVIDIFALAPHFKGTSNEFVDARQTF
jgi:hypothetical protein